MYQCIHESKRYGAANIILTVDINEATITCETFARTYKWCENQRIRRVRHSMSISAILSKRERTAPATTAGKAPGRAWNETLQLEHPTDANYKLQDKVDSHGQRQENIGRTWGHLA